MDGLVEHVCHCKSDSSSAEVTARVPPVALRELASWIKMTRSGNSFDTLERGTSTHQSNARTLIKGCEDVAAKQFSHQKNPGRLRIILVSSWDFQE